MDARLLAWARAVAARHRHHPRVPPLWLFTDASRLADPRPAVARLPKGLAGVVLRHDGDPARTALGRDLARVCRIRRLVLVVAGDPGLAATLGAGCHLRAGRWPAGAPVPRQRRPGTLLTSSAHNAADLRRAARAGVDLAFLSPAFATQSHPGAPSLGPLRWGRLARGANLSLAALGGITGVSIRRLPRGSCRAAGAIEALTPAPRHHRPKRHSLARRQSRSAQPLPRVPIKHEVV